MDPVVVIVTNKAFVTNFGGPVLSCIKANYCKYTLTVRHMFEIEMIYEFWIVLPNVSKTKLMNVYHILAKRRNLPKFRQRVTNSTDLTNEFVRS